MRIQTTTLAAMMLLLAGNLYADILTFTGIITNVHTQSYQFQDGSIFDEYAWVNEATKVGDYLYGRVDFNPNRPNDWRTTHVVITIDGGINPWYLGSFSDGSMIDGGNVIYFNPSTDPAELFISGTSNWNAGWVGSDSYAGVGGGGFGVQSADLASFSWDVNGNFLHASASGYITGVTLRTPESGTTLGLLALSLLGLVAFNLRRTLPMIFALALIGTASAQTITNVGYGIAGNGITATAQAYNIDITEDGSCIAINGHYWPVFADNASSPFTHVVKWDAVKSKYVPFGMIKAMTYDGTQLLSGTISIRTSPRMKVVMFKAFKVYTPKVMPMLVKYNDITVLWRDSATALGTGLFIEKPQLKIISTTTRGTIWLNADYTLSSAVLDNGANLFINNGGQLTVVPAPGGPTVPELLPYKMR